MIRIFHRSIPEYLTIIRNKVAEFGRDSLTAYEEPKSLALGFQCGDEAHLVGINTIRAHYKIKRDIPGFIVISPDTSPTVSQEVGIKMFTNDCKEALNSNKHGLS